MAGTFERTVCASIGRPLNVLGFESQGECTFVREGPDTVAVVWVVEGRAHLAGTFMPRLSVTLRAIGDDIAVLSADLHTLVSPTRVSWYRWRRTATEPDEVSQALEDLVSTGLPWLERHLNLDRLAAALEQKAALAKRGDANCARFLSYCYEAQGDIGSALTWWIRYGSMLTLVKDDSELGKQILQRRRMLESKV